MRIKALLAVFAVLVLAFCGCGQTTMDLEYLQEEAFQKGYEQGKAEASFEADNNGDFDSGYSAGYEEGYAAGYIAGSEVQKNEVSEEKTESSANSEGAGSASEIQQESEKAKHDYVLNKNSKKFHKPDCSSVGDIKEKNKGYFTGTREDIIAEGYEPCGRCNP